MSKLLYVQVIRSAPVLQYNNINIYQTFGSMEVINKMNNRHYITLKVKTQQLTINLIVSIIFQNVY